MRIGASFARVLWAVVLAACGRLGFDELDRGTPVAELPIDLDLSTECGAATRPTVDLAIANTGDGDLVISEASADGGFAVSTPLPLTIAAGDTRAITVVAPLAVVGTDLAGTTKDGTLTLVTNEAIGKRTVGLHAAVNGANLSFTDDVGNTITAFVFSGLSSCPAGRVFDIVNTGTEAASIALGGTSSVTAFAFASGSLDPGMSDSFVVRPVSAGPCSSSGGFVTYTVTGPVCTTTPAVLQTDFDIAGSSSCVCS